MKLQEAIQKAIEGGWSGKIVAPALDKYERLEYREAYDHAAHCVALLDPIFWQSLGKSLGWGKWTIPFERFVHEWELRHYQADTAKTPVYTCKMACGARKIGETIWWDVGDDSEEFGEKPRFGWSMTAHKSQKLESWEEHWHRFIDHLAEGKTIETYFEPL